MFSTMLLAVPADVAAGGPHWFFFGPLLFFFWIAVFVLLVGFVRGPWRRDGWRGGRPGGVERAREILAERYARGEISTEEYWERRDQLS